MHWSCFTATFFAHYGPQFWVFVGHCRCGFSTFSHSMNSQPIRLYPAMPRTCQPCTACCEGWMRISVFDQPVYPGQACPHLGEGGCKNYPARPQNPCIDFACGWVRGDSHLPDWMRPDEAKVVVLPAWAEWRTFPVDLALPVGARIPHKALKWLMEYSKDSFRPLIYTEQEASRNGKFTGKQMVRAFGPQPFLAEMKSVIALRDSALLASA